MSNNNTGKMNVAVYYNNSDIRLEERPIPKIGPGEILIKTEACSLCGGETMEWYLVPRAPKVLGHEPAGVVAEVGAGVEKFKVGDRVMAHHHVGCMSCHYCNRGYYTMCPEYKQVHLDPGGFAEYFRVSAHSTQFDTYLLPDNVSCEQATVIEPLACVLRGIKIAGIRPGDTVVVVGAGFMGMGFVQLARIWQAGKIVVSDLNDWRLEKALSLGATHTINPTKENAVEKLREINEGRLADSVMVTAPSSKAWRAALNLCDKGATLHVNAPPAPGEAIEIDPNELYFKEITINSGYSASHIDTRTILDYLSACRIDADALITHRFGLDGIGQAIQLVLQAGESLKALIIPALTKY